jgi:hypothetical protein
LEPNVWLHGSQSTITGGSSFTKARLVASIAWFEVSMRFVLITALGVPVEPEVNRILAMSSRPTLACALSTALPWSASSSTNNLAPRGGGFWPTISSKSFGTAASIALPNIAPSAA